MRCSYILFSMLLASLAVACGSGSGDENVAKAPESLMDGCEQDFSCSNSDAPSFRSRGTRRADGCVVGGALLAGDGTVHGELEPGVLSGTWSGNAAAFDACWTLKYPDIRFCYHCEHVSAPSSAPAPLTGAKCTGSPRSCSSGVPGACSDIQGCYLSTGYGEMKCAGVSRSCIGFYDESSCKNQGCKWE